MQPSLHAFALQHTITRQKCKRKFSICGRPFVILSKTIAITAKRYSRWERACISMLLQDHLFLGVVVFTNIRGKATREYHIDYKFGQNVDLMRRLVNRGPSYD